MSGPQPPVAVITGGASGIGLSLAQAYAEAGRVVLIGDIDQPALDVARTQLGQTGAEIHASVVDLRSQESVRALVELANRLGPIGAVCLNAGVTSTGTTTWTTPADVFDFMIDVNLRGLFNSIHGFLPGLIAQRTPADIIITASMAGMVSSPYSAAYAASKAGAIALAKALRRELETVAPHLNVVLLNPGMVKTNLILTSAGALPEGSGMTKDLVEGAHAALSHAGVEPAVAASWALQALDDKRFWALPPADDTFSAQLAAELSELQAPLTSGAAQPPPTRRD